VATRIDEAIHEYQEGITTPQDCASTLLKLMGVCEVTGQSLKTDYSKSDHQAIRSRKSHAKAVEQKYPELKAFQFWLVEIEGIKADTALQYSLRLNQMAQNGENLTDADVLLGKIKNNRSYPNYWQALAAIKYLVKFRSRRASIDR
jgi:hypothetical protein